MNTLTMKSTRILTLFLILFLLGSLNSNGQFVVKKVTGNSANTSQDGFYYALPQTVLKIDLLIEKIKKCQEVFNNKVIEHDNIKFNGGFSFGIAIFPEEAETIDELMKLADKRMYQNKKE